MFDLCHARQLDRIEALLISLLQKETAMAKTIQDLTNDVANEQTVEASAITLLNGLTASIAALKTQGTDPATAAAIDALASQVETNTAGLSAAVTTNTPAAGS